MKILTKAQVTDLLAEHKVFGGKSGPFLNKCVEVELGQALYLRTNEWGLKADPGAILNLSSRYNKKGALYGRRFSMKTLPNQAGWIFSRTI